MVTGLDLPSISTVSILAVVMGIVRWALHFYSTVQNGWFRDGSTEYSVSLFRLASSVF